MKMTTSPRIHPRRARPATPPPASPLMAALDEASDSYRVVGIYDLRCPGCQSMFNLLAATAQ